MTHSLHGTAGLLLAIAVSPMAGAQTATHAPMVSTPGSMEAAQAPCPATPSADLARWNAATPVVAATGSAGLDAATIQPGRMVRAALSPVATVSYPSTPGHAGEAGTFGGLLAFTAGQAGAYRVALGAGAWIDMVRDGQPVASAAHGHGPACGPIRKTMDFSLTPGRYVLQLSGNRTPTLTLMLARVPG